ncbi:54S ribosomal protein L4 mitochondrial [Coniosporium apollinis]|uniref:Large ribosomal subunit protein uL29m n=2 Tax=Coniosporium TaxID=2810619 RepID=A0ABQ9P578_9PEZI|nr:54S ribosomal protein L4 mitochondrial [Cladosporium sp. JES 115]KAJ9669665.1 54S ribosomal protein L4 mitochondrial [Coniosporium apollinis]
MSTPCLARRLCPRYCLQTAEPLFGFLAPSVLPKRVHSTPCISRFSTSQNQSYPRRDRNADRGVSAVRRTGLRPRQTLSVKKLDLPTPVLDPSKRSKVQVDEDHGLWQFFGTERRAMALPEEVGAHGRAWTVEELRHKGWDDLHALWWVCVKERNRIKTQTYELLRLEAGYGEYEAEERDKTIRDTQRAIKAVLTERWYAWEDARRLAVDDPEVNLDPNEGPAYTPTVGYSEDELAEGGVEDNAAPPERGVKHASADGDSARPGELPRGTTPAQDAPRAAPAA